MLLQSLFCLDLFNPDQCQPPITIMFICGHSHVDEWLSRYRYSTVISELNLAAHSSDAITGKYTLDTVSLGLIEYLLLSG